MPGPLLSIFLIVLVDIFGMTLVFPLLGIYAERFSATPLQATMLVSVFAGCQLVAGPIIGSLSDRFGRKRLLLLCQLGTFVGFVIMAKAHALWMLYLARAIDGTTAGNLALAQAYIADTTKPENRTRSFALIGIAFGLGFFVGPALTGYLVRYGMNAPIWAAAGMSALSIVCTIVLLPRHTPVATSDDAGPAGRRPSIFAVSLYSELFSRPGLSTYLWQMLAYLFAFSLFTSGFALFAERRFMWHGMPFSPREVGYVFAYAGFLGIILQGGLIGRLVKKFGEHTLTVWGFLTLAIAYVGLAWTHDVGLLIAVTTVSSFGNGVCRPTLTGLISRNARPEEQGTVLGVSQSLSSIGALFAPIVGGLLLERGALVGWPLVAAAVSGLGLCIAVSYRPIAAARAA